MRARDFSTGLAIAALALSLSGASRASRSAAAGMSPQTRAGKASEAVDASAPSADGVPIRYHAEGSGEPALVFVHCWSCSSAFWSGQVKEFAPGHRVVTLDLGGHGRSGRDRKEWSIASFAGDVRAVVEALGLRRVILVGHSMGGYVALEAARLMPDRVIGLIPVDTLQNADYADDPKELKTFLDSMQLDFRGTTLEFVRSMFLPGARADLVERVAQEMASQRSDIGVGSLRSALSYSPKSSLKALRIPICAVVSEKYPAKTEVNRRYAPQFEAVTLPGTGHFLMLEKPAEFNALLAKAIEAVSGRAPAAPAAQSGVKP